MKYMSGGAVLFLMFCCICISCKQQQPKASANNVADSIQQNMYASIDRSPLDMSYYPSDYPLEKMNNLTQDMPVARVIYSRPHKNGRVIFGADDKSVVQYGLPWRLGANEATEISFFKNVSISGSNINKGSYVLYCIPYPDRWTIIFNNNLYAWGLHIDSTHDVLKLDIPVMNQEPSIEDFTIVFKDMPYGADLLMSWDKVKTTLPIEFAKP